MMMLGMDEGSRNDDGRVLWRQMLQRKAPLWLFFVVPHRLKRRAAQTQASSSRKGGRLAGSNVHEGKEKEKEKEKERRKMSGATKCPS
jgi:hypothetical protein